MKANGLTVPGQEVKPNTDTFITTASMSKVEQEQRFGRVEKFKLNSRLITCTYALQASSNIIRVSITC